MEDTAHVSPIQGHQGACQGQKSVPYVADTVRQIAPGDESDLRWAELASGSNCKEPRVTMLSTYIRWNKTVSLCHLEAFGRGNAVVSCGYFP